MVVDLGRVYSRYGSETENVLAELFDSAEREGWILVFDEADALFGKRTEVASAHDRYARLDVDLLLQRIEGLSARLTTRIGEAGQAEALAGYAVRHFPQE